jgi:hypothetical protein
VYGEDVLVNVWVSGENKSRWWSGIIVGAEQASGGKYYDVLLAYWDQDYPMRFIEKDVRPAKAKDRSEPKEQAQPDHQEQGSGEVLRRLCVMCEKWYARIRQGYSCRLF